MQVDTRYGRTRAALLAGVSVISLAVASSQVWAADPAPAFTAAAPAPRGELRVWAEGGAFWTGGEDIYSFFDLASGTGLFALKPDVGWEAAGGFDYRFAGTPWHVSAQFRYGRADQSDAFGSTFAYAIPPVGAFATDQGATVRHRETHWLADFAVGRDLGLGRDPLQVKLGVRIAEITARTAMNNAVTSTFTFGVPITYGGFAVTGFNTFIDNATDQRSRFLGAGPRLGVEGSAALSGGWSFDYLADFAVLFGREKYTHVDTEDVSGAFIPVLPLPFPIPATTTTVITDVSRFGAVVNADIQAGISYWFNPNIKVTASYRLDAYFRTLAALDVTNDPANPEKIERYFHGPRLALTGRFGDPAAPLAGDMPAIIGKAPAPVVKGELRAWVEGGGFWTAGGSMQTFSPDPTGGGPFGFVGLGSLPLSTKPDFGWDVAAGFDHRFAGSPWHISAQVRYGRATGSANPVAAAFTSTYYGAAVTEAQSAQAEQKETHWLADFAVGRDLGLGHGPVQLKGGVRIAEINARTNTLVHAANEISLPAPIPFGGGFITGFVGEFDGFDEQRSTFRGIGPRLGVEGAVPFAGAWSVDYLADVAVLLGTRRFQQIVNTDSGFATVPPLFVFDPGVALAATNTTTDLGGVFNVDAQLGLSYWVTPGIKVTGSYRVDAFFDALLTLDTTNDPTRLTKVDRIYHGPKFAVTGVF